MTVQPAGRAAAPTVPSAAVDGTIAATAWALLAGRHMKPVELAEIMSLSKTTIYAKLNGAAPFKASEVAEMAEVFGVEIMDFYDGLGGRFSPTPGGGAGRPRQDSNLRHTVYKFAGRGDAVTGRPQLVSAVPGDIAA